MKKVIVFSAIFLFLFSSSVLAMNEYEWTPGETKASYTFFYNYRSTTYPGRLTLDYGQDDLLGIEASIAGQRSWYILNGGIYNLDLNLKRKAPWELFGIKLVGLLGGGLIYSQASGSNAFYITGGGIAHRPIGPNWDLKGYLTNSFFSDGGIINMFGGVNYKGWQDKEITFGYNMKFSYLSANMNTGAVNSYIILGIRSGW